MLKESEKQIHSTYFEGMTSIRAIISGMDKGVNDRRIETIYYDKNKIIKNHKEIGYLKAVSSKYDFEVVETSSEEIDNIALGTSHGGIIAKASERSLPHFSTMFSERIPNSKGDFFVIIDGIEDPYNFGYAIRSLYACGCDGIILGERNWMSAAGVVARSSAGASEMLPIYSGDILACLDLFKENGYNIICADERTDNILGECDIKFPLLLLVGGEKRGISRAVLDKADTLIKIDYAKEFRASLSAASAATMFGYEIMRQNKKKK